MMLTRTEENNQFADMVVEVLVWVLIAQKNVKWLRMDIGELKALVKECRTQTPVWTAVPCDARCALILYVEEMREALAS